MIQQASDISATWSETLHSVSIGHKPFQMGRKQPHHLKSKWNPAFKRTQCSSLTHFESSFIRRKKDPSITLTFLGLELDTCT